MPAMDFPFNPALGQQYINDYGVVYTWNGVAWLVGVDAAHNNPYRTLGDLLSQIRTLLQDTDAAAGYRYTTASIVANLNQGLIEMYRIRPDLFLELGFVIPTFTYLDMAQPLQIEQQYIPSLIYYAVGLTQARDDEQNQDARAAGFLKAFQSSIVTGALTS